MKILFLFLTFCLVILQAEENIFPLKITFNLPKDAKIADGSECTLYNNEPFSSDKGEFKENSALFKDLRKSPIGLEKVVVGNFVGIINKQVYLKKGIVNEISVDLIEHHFFQGKVLGSNETPLNGILIRRSNEPFSRIDKYNLLKDLRDRIAIFKQNDFSDKDGLFTKEKVDFKRINYFFLIDPIGNWKEYKVLPEDLEKEKQIVFDFTPISDLKIKFATNNGNNALKTKIRFNLYDLNEYSSFNLKDRMITDENGEAILTQLKETEYVICVESEKYVNRRMNIIIKKGAIQELFYDLVDGATVKGKVSCEGNEYGGIQLQLHTEDLRQEFVAKVNSNGEFEFGGLDSNIKYKLFTALQGYANDESIPKIVQPPNDNLELKFLKIPEIVGYAKDFDGSPAKRFSVSLASKVGNKFTVFANKMPFENGKFYFHPNNFGWHEVIIYISNSVVFKKKFEINEKGISEKLEFQADNGKKIFGKVENSLGEPIEGAFIQENAPLYDNGGPHMPFAFTDKDGKFCIESQAMGNELYANAKNYAAKNFVLSNDFLTEGLIVMEKGFTTKGVLKNQFNLPIDKVQIYADLKSKDIQRSVLSETDKDGKYEMDSMIPGTWIMKILIVQKNGKRTITKEVIVKDKDIELDLEAIVPEVK